MRSTGSRAIVAYVPFWAKEKDVGAGDHKGKDNNSQEHEKGQMFGKLFAAQKQWDIERNVLRDRHLT